MEPEEQIVVDEFQGRKKYTQVFTNPERYLVSAGGSMLQIGA